MQFHLSVFRDDGVTSEWGYFWQKLNDGTMGQPSSSVIEDLNTLDDFAFPCLDAEKRQSGIEEFKRRSQECYHLGNLDISGFTTYTFIRGFSNIMLDFASDNPLAFKLLDKIFELETEIIRLAAALGFDGIHFTDDWGTQEGLIISPQMWRKIFKSRYKKQFEFAHNYGLHVWFHCCGKIDDILIDFNEIGVDVMNISQPNVVDVSKAGLSLKGTQCFLLPINYQTASISGTPDDIYKEAERLF